MARYLFHEVYVSHFSFFFFFFNATATTEIYTLSLHDALPICGSRPSFARNFRTTRHGSRRSSGTGDRKSTRLNSSHVRISYAVFCLKKKKTNLNSAIERQALISKAQNLAPQFY